MLGQAVKGRAAESSSECRDCRRTNSAESFSLTSGPDGIDQQAALRLKRAAAQEFRAQLTIGAPNDNDEAGLRRLSAQLKASKVVVKLFLRHTLHAKLYLIHRTDPNNPSIGFVGSSNLTFAGLSKQGS